MLWVTLLQRTTDNGIDINAITFTTPTMTVISDACETGLGGFTSDGKAWRYELPENMRGCFTINVVEFIASVITIYLLPPSASALNCTASMRKSIFRNNRTVSTLKQSGVID